MLGRIETRTRVRIYCQTIRTVRDISRDDRARIATCSLQTPTDLRRIICIDEHKGGIRTDPLCNSTSIGTYSVPPFCLTTCILIDLYISCTLLTYSSGTPFFLKHHQIRSLGILSNAFSRSKKTMCKYLFFSPYFSCSCCNAKTGSVAFRPFS